ncbi:trans-sulfuration enzyme family protein [Ferrimonas lipolytica]|uniref:Aminotransferase class I/II-fold pyridoxal phosphate-dependent enzyme n=1 Tax=Ferrimonas lipolytica TaxID=2724191 RepID=A0A6H1U9W1_9GAMM|nr:aminotransferase class I/II-fold pyridoxal phosphate-dependent enzyme [Ferrimonas lipolytica]QIZ75831.1 aminotransferase class I/II-fold pyridoxal phosphate-dependent enzyme [Ferrimonas lipolytica]
MDASMHPETCVIHGGHQRDSSGSLTTPLLQTATFAFDDCHSGGQRFAGEQAGPIYTRLGNPTTNELERRIALLEGSEDALAFASGMGAVAAALLGTLQSGDHLIVATSLYGCSHSLATEQLPRFGIEVTQVDFAQLAEVESAIQANTKLMLLETPVNPHLQAYDLDSLVSIAKAHDIITVVDNTFMTPLLQKPLSHGVDLVLHSATKYLNGHGDVIAGLVCGRAEMIDPLRNQIRKDFGAVLSPHDAWLILRGMKTLALRMERHCDSALKIARYLQTHPTVAAVHYPGLESHMGYGLIGTQMKAGGGVVAIELCGDYQTALSFVDALRLFTIAVSLGDPESLVQHPASMTHSCYQQEERRAAGISDNLVRLAIGLEHCDDLIADLEQALSHCHTKERRDETV